MQLGSVALPVLPVNRAKQSLRGALQKKTQIKASSLHGSLILRRKPGATW